MVSVLLINDAAAQKQKVTYENETISVDGTPYAKMTKKSAGVFVNDFSIKNLNGIELIYLRYKSRPKWDYLNNRNSSEVYYEINFIASGAKANIFKQFTAKSAATLPVENDLIKDNAIDMDAERRFIQVYNGYYPKVEQAPQPTVLVINNSSDNSNKSSAPNTPAKSKSPVVISDNQFTQDGIDMGKFSTKTGTGTNEEKSTIITIYAANGDKVAEATAPIDNPSEWSVKTFSDNKSSGVLYDSPKEKEVLFKWLIDKGYL